MIVGFIVGAIRMILDFTHLEPRCGEEDTRPGIIAKVHYMYFALILFWITVITIVVISYFTKPRPEGNVSRTLCVRVYAFTELSGQTWVMRKWSVLFSRALNCAPISRQ